MTLDDKCILLISPEPWDHVFVSKHHYAVHLGKRNNKVFFLNPPGKNWNASASGLTNVTVVDYPKFPPGLRYYPRFFQRMFIRQKFEELQRRLKVTFDVVWSFDNSVFYDFDALPENVLKILHIVDLNQDFQSAQAASTAQFCFCTTELIRTRLIQFNPRSFKINHGFNAVTSVQRKTLPGKSNVKALYSGNLSMPFMDWSLINRIVADHAEVDFIFIGPAANDFSEDEPQHTFKRKVFSADNVFSIGRVDADVLPSYLASADILLVSYQEKYRDDQANPHKIMEYLGSGKIILATSTDEYNHLSMPVMANVDYKKFSEAFTEICNDIAMYNTPELSEKRKAIAADNTYVRQIERIEEKINLAE
jgi:hypothetical protein